MKTITNQLKHTTIEIQIDKQLFPCFRKISEENSYVELTQQITLSVPFCDEFSNLQRLQRTSQC